MTEKLRSIQCLRALAVGIVLVSHGTFWPHGQAGVDLFFVISGVIIGKVMQGRSAKEFMLARLWRIYPIYWFNALPLLLAAAVAGIVTPARLATTLTLWPIWPGGYAPPYLNPAWTLSFEMLFYSLVALGLATNRTKFVVPTLVAAVAINALTGNPVLQFVGNPLVLEFCAGLIVGRLPRNAAAGGSSLALAAILFVLSPIVHTSSAHVMDLPLNAYRVAVWGVPAALAVYGALCLNRSFGAWATVPVFLGDASYSIYLSHYFLNLALPMVWWPLRVVIFLAAGSAMYWFVERQFTIWRRRMVDGTTRSTSMKTDETRAFAAPEVRASSETEDSRALAEASPEVRASRFPDETRALVAAAPSVRASRLTWLTRYSFATRR